MITYINNLLFLLQNEHYEVVRFLKTVYRLHRHSFRKTSQLPDRTKKSSIGVAVSGILFF